MCLPWRRTRVVARLVVDREQGAVGQPSWSMRGHRYIKLPPCATFSFAAIADWAQDSLAIGCSDLDGWLASRR